MRNLPRKKRGRQRASVLEYVGRVSRGGRGKGSRGGRKSVAALLETRPFNATADDCQRNWIIPLRNFTSFHVILRRINRKDWSTNNPRKKKIEGGEKKKKERKKETHAYSFTSKHFDSRIMRFSKRGGACGNRPPPRRFIEFSILPFQLLISRILFVGVSGPLDAKYDFIECRSVVELVNEAHREISSSRTSLSRR